MEIADLLAQVRGNVLTPSHANYDLARKLWNGMVDQRPASIVQCIGTADVVAGQGLLSRS